MKEFETYMKRQAIPIWLNRIRHQFLLTFFDPEERYQEKEVNGFFLVKQFNKLQMTWEVAIYTKESFQKRKDHQSKVKNLLNSRGNKQSDSK